jgi:hypothetical protein
MLTGTLDTPYARYNTSTFDIIRFIDQPGSKSVTVTFQLGSRSFLHQLLWQGNEYDARPDYTDADIVAGVKSLLEKMMASEAAADGDRPTPAPAPAPAPKAKKGWRSK